MKRYIYKNIVQDLKKKMVFIVWPRQSWKTWISKEIAKKYKNSIYLNFDRLEDREMILKEQWPDNTDLIIFDEIHKMNKWKNYIKWVFDTKKDNLHILVTGSARINTFRKTWDSLAWRVFVHHLLPFSVKELTNVYKNNDLIELLINRWWFPEPFLAENDQLANRWRFQYIDWLIRNDILDFENILNLNSINNLLKILKTKVGSPISYTSLAEDLQISFTTVKKYIEILESLFIIFKITPSSKNILRSLLKEPKIYFFDTWMVEWDKWIKLENMIAISLLKHVYYKKDMIGEDVNLQYLRTKDWKEVDFCLTQNNKQLQLIEVKYSNNELSKPLFYFHKKYNIPSVQVVKEIKKEKTINWINIIKADKFLLKLEL